MDGIRAYWDGHKLLSRHGRELSPPEHFTRGLPNTPLDGELWIGRNSFQKLMEEFSSKTSSWDNIHYHVFDLPTSEELYEQRMALLHQMSFPSHVHIVKSERCMNVEHLEQLLESILAEEGEGIVAREPNSKYCPGRTPSILKIKVDDYSNDLDYLCSGMRIVN